MYALELIFYFRILKDSVTVRVYGNPSSGKSVKCIFCASFVFPLGNVLVNTWKNDGDTCVI